MQESQRLYHCLRCRAQVVICSRCDRGNRYCPQGCSQLARQESLNRAGKKYQQTRTGRVNNAARQQRFRERQRQKVTHQCSNDLTLYDVVKRKPVKRSEAEKVTLALTYTACHFCDRQGNGFFRQDFLHSSRFKPVFRRQN